MIILNERLLLRKPDPRDLDDLLAVKNNKEAGRLLGGYKEEYTPEDIVKWIDFHATHPNELLYVMYDMELGKVIGHVGLYDIDKRVRKAEFGILIGNEKCQGKGYGSLCLKHMIDVGFGEMGLNRIELSLLKENLPALKLYEKHGFQVEGVLKQAQYKHGRFYDVILMALMKDEYK